jgi:transposase
MNIAAVEYLADQIKGHIDYLKRGNTYDDNSSVMNNIRASYPSTFNKPFDVRIWYNPRIPQVFFLKWKDKRVNTIRLDDGKIDSRDDSKSFSERLKDYAHITVLVKDLDREIPAPEPSIFKIDIRWLKTLAKEGRRKWAKRRKGYEGKISSAYRNLIVTSKDHDRDMLLVQLCIYLSRDDFLNKGDFFALFEKAIERHFPKNYHKIIGKHFKDPLYNPNQGLIIAKIFKRALSNFFLPTEVYSFKHYLGTNLLGQISHENNIPISNLQEARAPNQVPPATYYRWINSKKLPMKKDRNRYIKTPETEKILSKLINERNAKKERVAKNRNERNIKSLFQEVVRDIADEKKIKYKSIMRGLQREGLKNIKDRCKYLTRTYPGETTEQLEERFLFQNPEREISYLIGKPDLNDSPYNRLAFIKDAVSIPEENE